MNLQMLKHIPAGTEGHPRGTRESCGLHLWSEGGYRVPGLKGLFCLPPKIKNPPVRLPSTPTLGTFVSIRLETFVRLRAR